MRFYVVIYGDLNSPSAASNAYTDNWLDYMDFVVMRRKLLMYAIHEEDIRSGIIGVSYDGLFRGCTCVDVVDENEFIEVMDSATGMTFTSVNYIHRAFGTPSCCYTDNELIDPYFSGSETFSAYQDSIGTSVFILMNVICALKTLLEYGIYSMINDSQVQTLKTFIRRIMQYLIVVHESSDSGAEIEWFIEDWEDIDIADISNIYDTYPDGLINDAVAIREFLSGSSILEPLPFDDAGFDSMLDDDTLRRLLINRFKGEFRNGGIMYG